MKLTIEGELNRYYAETLCMIVYPGAKFPTAGADDDISAGFSLSPDGERCRVTITHGGRCAVGEYTAESCADAALRAKIAAGGAFLACAKKLYGITPPWGILTGVRPSKLAMKLLFEGLGASEAKERMHREYLLTPEKAALCVSVAQTEKKIVTQETYKQCSVYISIPFCPSRCSYCSFVSYTSEKFLGLIPDYLEALKSDIDGLFELIASLELKVATVYIGGGTPTVLSCEQLQGLLSKIASVCDVSSLSEFTLEAGRPDTIDDRKLAIAKRFGVTRISVNCQTLSDEILQTIGRRHTADDFFRAFDSALNSGIEHVNVDLIAGLPGDTPDNFRRTLDKIITLDCDNITVHTFCVKKSAGIRQSDPEIYARDSECAKASVEYSQNALEKALYKPYYMYRQKNTAGNLENVGFARPGCEGLYNIFMMEEIHTVFALGAAGVSKLVRHSDSSSEIKRVFECKYPYEYLNEHRRNEQRIKRLEKAANEFYGGNR